MEIVYNDKRLREFLKVALTVSPEHPILVDKFLDGAIEFLRIARGTLADSKTTIDELHAWQFNGPFLRDFTGRKRPADGGAAGAIDAVAP